ncbi:MAG: hypothetical protein ACMG6H_15715 [Acidobacteriota bacterium]
MNPSLIKRVVTPIFVCLLTLFVASSAPAQGKQDFDLVNKTGFAIKEVYITPHNANEWGENVFDDDAPLKNGDTTTILFSRTEKAKLWDLKVIDSAGNDFEWENLNLLEISEVTLTRKCVVAFTTK